MTSIELKALISNLARLPGIRSESDRESVSLVIDMAYDRLQKAEWIERAANAPGGLEGRIDQIVAELGSQDWGPLPLVHELRFLRARAAARRDRFRDCPAFD